MSTSLQSQHKFGMSAQMEEDENQQIKELGKDPW